MKNMILVFFVAIIFATAGGGVYLYYYNNHKIHPILPEPDTLLVKNPTKTINPTKIQHETPKPSRDSEADNLLQNFYDFYSSCLAGHYATTPSKKDPSRSPQDDCPYNQTGALTDQLALKLKPVVGYDPILCTQTIPTQITHTPVRVIGNRGISLVHEEFIQPTPARKIKISTTSAQLTTTVDIQVQLEFQNAQWQISTITCPKTTN